jgi:rhodanese-related sulfurtransferase
MQRRVLLVLLATLLLAGLVAPAVFADGPVQPAAEQYYAGGPKTIKAADLYANLNDGDASNDPYLIDVRAAADFANGHIKGANNVDVKVLFTPAELAKLPADGPIVVNCYSGQTSGQAVAALQMLGYDAYSLTYGIPSWGTNEKVTYPFTADQSGNYAVVTDAATLEGGNTAPAPLGDTVSAAAAAYFAGGTKNIKAADVFANLNDGDADNDPVIIDFRSAEDYALGHIAGAANVNIKTLFTTAELAKLPADKQIVGYCYSGQTCSQAVAGLRMLGYDAYNMSFGLPSWAIVPGVSVPVWDVSKSGNYPLEVTAAAAPAPAADAAAAPAAAPATLPTTGGAFPTELVILAVALGGAGIAALRKR